MRLCAGDYGGLPSRWQNPLEPDLKCAGRGAGRCGGVSQGVSMLRRKGFDLSISTRINLAFAAIVGLLILLEISAVIGFRAGSHRFLQFSGIADVAERVTQVAHDVVSLDRFAGRYASNGEEEDLQQAREVSSRIGASLAGLIADEYAGGVNDELRRMESLLAAYSADLLQVAQIRAERDNQVNWKLNGTGIKARASLMQIMREAAAGGDSAAAVNAGIANDYLQGARLNTYKFLAVPSAQLTNAADSQIDAFIKACDALAGSVQAPTHKVLAAQVSEQGREYKASFAKIAASTSAMTALVTDSLAKYGSEIRSIAGKVAESRRQTMSGERDASIAEIVRTLAISLAAALAAVAGGGLIAVWTNRAVVQPLHDLSEVTMRLSSGDTTVNVEGTRRRDEIGMLARALEHFRLSIVAEVETQRVIRADGAERCRVCEQRIIERVMARVSAPEANVANGQGAAGAGVAKQGGAAVESAAGVRSAST
jgi:HAMP domain-containing protein